MCGIAGLIAPDGLAAAGYWPQRVVRRLEHRGPDDHGWLILNGESTQLGRGPVCGADGQVFLMNRRLSILDLSEAGWQPMTAANGRYAIVFNGEIYNFVELRRELEALGHTFRSGSDTEVLLAAYIEWGPRALPRLIGMFAFAILDTCARTLFLARDFFGIKPLYYATPRGGFAFASEIKALIDLPGVSRRVDPQPFYSYLRFGIALHGTRTLFADIQQLPPAHYVHLSLDHPSDVQPVRYWQIELTERRDLSFDEAAEHVRELFLDSVRLHIRSDVPVGVALSGGIDSSAVVMAMREIQGRGLDLHSFSYIPEQGTASEERYIDLVSQVAGTVVHKVQTNPRELIADMTDMVNTQDVPFPPLTYPQYRVFRLAHEAGIKVMMSGQGADEILAGYRPFLAARLASHVRRGELLQAGRFLGQVSKLDDIRPLDLVTQMGGLLLPAELQGLARRLARRELFPRWLNAAWFLEHGVQPVPLRQRGGRRVLQEQLHNAFAEWSLPHELRYEDRNSMAFSVESRLPFLTPAMASFLFSLPEEYLIDTDGTSKAVFRRAMRGIVPDAILDRRDKIGFGVAEGEWLRSVSPAIEQTLYSRTADAIPALNVAALRQEWQMIRRQRRPVPPSMWCLFCAIRWAEQFEVSFE